MGLDDMLTTDKVTMFCHLTDISACSMKYGQAKLNTNVLFFIYFVPYKKSNS